MARLPARGSTVHELDLPLPPERMPTWRGTRPLKRWRYVGVFGPEIMLCVGEARVGLLPRRWWAVAEADGTLDERATLRRGGVRLDGAHVTVRARDVEIDLRLEEGPGVEVVSPSGPAYIWTRKQGCVPVRARVAIGSRERRLDGEAFVDDSAGYHERRTRWRWSAGNGWTAEGERIAWNLVAGVHDGPFKSERTLWVDGEPREVGPVEFAPDLSRVAFSDGGTLEFSEWCAREEQVNLLLLRSDYRQPFGRFTGELPGGIRLLDGYGVMEEHEALW